MPSPPETGCLFCRLAAEGDRLHEADGLVEVAKMAGRTIFPLRRHVLGGRIDAERVSRALAEAR